MATDAAKVSKYGLIDFILEGVNGYHSFLKRITVKQAARLRCATSALRYVPLTSFGKFKMEYIEDALTCASDEYRKAVMCRELLAFLDDRVPIGADMKSEAVGSGELDFASCFDTMLESCQSLPVLRVFVEIFKRRHGRCKDKASCGCEEFLDKRLLETAACGNSVHVFRYLLDQEDVDPLYGEAPVWTPMEGAIHSDSLEGVKALCEKVGNGYGERIEHLALSVELGNERITEYLLKRTRLIQDSDFRKSVQDLLIRAVNLEHVEIVTLLLLTRCEPGSKERALEAACSRNTKERGLIIDTLFAMGCEVNASKHLLQVIKSVHCTAEREEEKMTEIFILDKFLSQDPSFDDPKALEYCVTCCAGNCLRRLLETKLGENKEALMAALKFAGAQKEYELEDILRSHLTNS